MFHTFSHSWLLLMLILQNYDTCTFCWVSPSSSPGSSKLPHHLYQKDGRNQSLLFPNMFPHFKERQRGWCQIVSSSFCVRLWKRDQSLKMNPNCKPMRSLHHSSQDIFDINEWASWEMERKWLREQPNKWVFHCL